MPMSPSESSLAARIGPHSPPSHDSRKPIFRNRVWKREPTPPTIHNSSLMDRIEPDTKSLLRRVSMTLPGTSPVSDKPSLAERLTSPTSLAERETERKREDVRETRRLSQLDGDLAEEFIASAIEGGKHTQPVGQAYSPEERRSPTSEDAVDDLLASGRDADDDEEHSISGKENELPEFGHLVSVGMGQRLGSMDRPHDVATSGGADMPPSDAGSTCSVTERHDTGLKRLTGDGDMPSIGTKTQNGDANTVTINTVKLPSKDISFEDADESRNEQTPSLGGQVWPSWISGGVPDEDALSSGDKLRGHAEGPHAAPSSAFAQPVLAQKGSSNSSQNTTGVIDPELLEEAKRLLIPVITQNAQLRDPNADTEMIRNKILSLVTDEQCLEFVRLAKVIKDQMREKQEEQAQSAESVQNELVARQEHVGELSSGTDMKRQRDWSEDETERLNKVPRLEQSGETGEIASSAVEHTHTSAPLTPTDAATKERSPSAKRTPRAPRAMLAHPERYRATEFLRFVAESDIHSSPTPCKLQPPHSPRAVRSPTPPRVSPASLRAMWSPTTPRDMDLPTSLPPPSPRALRTDLQSDTGTQANKLELDVTVERPSTAIPSVGTSSPVSASMEVVQEPQETAQKTSGILGLSPSDLDLVELNVPDSFAPVEEPMIVETPDDRPVETIAERRSPEATYTTEADKGPAYPSASPMEVDEPSKAFREEVENDNEDQVMASETAHASDDKPISQLDDAPNKDGSISEPTIQYEGLRGVNSDTAPSSPPQETALERSPSLVQAEQPQPAAASPSPVPHPIEPPKDPVPGLWFVAIGKDAPDVYDIEFEVSEESATAARRWSERDKTFDPSVSHACVHLLCLPVSDVCKMNQELDPAASPDTVVDMLHRVPTKWPPSGKLIIQLNGDSTTSDIWLLKHLVPKDGPMDVSPFIRPGRNTARIIQLSDCSDCVFVLCAGVPSDEVIPRFRKGAPEWVNFSEHYCARIPRTVISATA